MFLEQVQKWISSFQSFHTFQVSQALIYDMNNEPDRTSRACTPVLQNLRLFAIETIETIETMIEISEKCAEPTSPFCATLRSALWDIKTELQEHRQYYDETESGKVEILLDSLEELCGGHQSTIEGQWPNLEDLGNPKRQVETANTLRKLIADQSLTRKRSDIIQRLEEFSATGLKNEVAEVPHNTNIWTARGPSQELKNDIQLLYATLEQYRFCRAGSPERDFNTKIRLNGYRTLGVNSDPNSFTVDNASAEFGVLFLGHPHLEESYWQETCIQICHTSKTNSSVSNPDPDAPQNEHIAYERFCHNIGRNQDLLCLSIRDGKFVYHERSDATRDWLAGCRAVPLSSAFTQPDLNLNVKSKAILQMLLAKATWEFYDSAIIGQGLTSDDIHFIPEKRDGIAGPFVNEAVLRTLFTQDVGQKNETSSQVSKNASSANMIHKMPKILALGIILLEIETGKSMRTHRLNPRVRPSGDPNINTDYQIACKLVDTGPKAHQESIISDINKLSPLRKILPLCIKPGEFRTRLQHTLSAQKKSTSDINDPKEQRSFIYHEIILPLKAWANTYDEHSRLKVLWEVRERQETSVHLPSLTASQLGSRKLDGDFTLREGSRSWFRHYELLKNYLMPEDVEMGKSYERVKIAILDTGITQEDYDYLRDSLENSTPPLEYEYKDFVRNAAEDTACDSSGHGSAGVSLLLKTCPHASLYIARVLETCVVVKDDVERVVQGIDWAIDKQVDIITMALGFERARQPVIDAIDRAYRRGILIFAAASNGRNFNPVYCPAILTDQVFGIFSTNAGIRESQSLNPAPIGGDNFAIFGENIELSDEGPLVKGTSYSTSIAAGLAAMLLDFVRQEADINIMQELSNLKKKQGMRMVFWEMARPDNGYLCIRPWKLLGRDRDSAGYSEENGIRKEKREWIRGTIVRLLQPEKMHEL